MHRHVLLIVFAAVLSTSLNAQRGQPAASVPPPVVFPFPPLMQPVAGGLRPGTPFQPPAPPGATRDLFLVGSVNQVHRPRPRSYGAAYGTGIAYDTGIPYSGASPAQLADTPPRPASGLLRLSVTPPTAQVFVDGYYVGSVSDIDAQHGLTLDAGPHRIELRAPGYDPATVNVQITPFDPITYRTALEPVQAPMQSSVPAARPAMVRGPMYVIPRCYMGNVPPRADHLPPGCRVADVQVLNNQ